MDRYAFALTELSYQVPPHLGNVGLPVTMLASIKPAELNKVTTDALATGYTAEISAAHFRQAVKDRQSYLGQLLQINTDYRENVSDGVFKHQRIASGYIRFDLSPPSSLLDEILDGMNKLEKPAISDEFAADINLASETVEYTEERAAKAEQVKDALYEQTLLAKEIELKQKHLGRAVRIGSALTSAVIIGGCTFGLLHEIMQGSDARAERVVSELPEAAQDEFSKRYDGEGNRSRNILIGAVGLGAAYVSGLNGYVASRRPAARFAQYRAQRIVKKA